MNWKIIGQSTVGTSHLQTALPCQDALSYSLSRSSREEVLVCCVSDGAGSAKYAEEASAFVTRYTTEMLSEWISQDKSIDDASLLELAEHLYDHLKDLSDERGEPLNEFSCTYLGCVLYEASSIFFQVGDGVIIRDDGNGGFVPVWWPQNGEYSNTTCFLVDDPLFSNLRRQVLGQRVSEIALLTDGLQTITLNNETASVHQPFFADLFGILRRAANTEETAILDRKLADFLSGERINAKTDDDKTLFLATRLSHE